MVALVRPSNKRTRLFRPTEVRPTAYRRRTANRVIALVAAYRKATMTADRPRWAERAGTLTKTIGEAWRHRRSGSSSRQAPRQRSPRAAARLRPVSGV